MHILLRNRFCQNAFMRSVCLHIKINTLKDQAFIYPSPNYSHILLFPKLQSLRFLGSYATPGRKREARGHKGGALDPITAYGDVGCWLGWENQPHKGSWLWESCHAPEHLGGVRSGDKIWKHDMLQCLAQLEQYAFIFSPASHLHVWSTKGGPPLRAETNHWLTKTEECP